VRSDVPASRHPDRPSGWTTGYRPRRRSTSCSKAWRLGRAGAAARTRLLARRSRRGREDLEGAASGPQLHQLGRALHCLRQLVDRLLGRTCRPTLGVLDGASRNIRISRRWRTRGLLRVEVERVRRRHLEVGVGGAQRQDVVAACHLLGHPLFGGRVDLRQVASFSRKRWTGPSGFARRSRSLRTSVSHNLAGGGAFSRSSTRSSGVTTPDGSAPTIRLGSVCRPSVILR